MINLAQFRITGRIGQVRDTGKVAYVSIATDSQVRDEAGNWNKHTDWNTVTLFSDSLRKRLANGAGRVGNLIAIEGRIRSGSYDKDGETLYRTDLIGTDMEVLHFARKEEDKPAAKAKTRKS